MKKNNLKAWLYLLPAFIFLGFFTIYPLVDIFVYSFEENFQFTSEATGIGFGNYNFVLNDEKFLSAVRNTDTMFNLSFKRVLTLLTPKTVKSLIIVLSFFA